MSTINANVADYLTQIEALTKTNLQLLEAFNHSFVTNKDNLIVEIDTNTSDEEKLKYVIPSFVSLENKVNLLQENFNNLVNAPESGEAYFNVNGNSRSIEVCKYNTAPPAIELPIVDTFGIESNNIFKDMLTPQPYINFAIPNITNDITEVNVKKIVAISDSLKFVINSKLNNTVISENGLTTPVSMQMIYSDMNSMLSLYKKDIDYIEYDSVYKLPIKKQGGTGEYVIKRVVRDYIDDNLDNIIILEIARKTDGLSNLNYKWLDETLERPLSIGDELTTYDGTGKVVITNVNTNTHTITVKVLNGDYLNFIGIDTTGEDYNNASDASKLRFYSTLDFTSDKYVKVPLENDQFVYIAIAPINSRMRVQSSWGTGVLINTHALTHNDKTFNEYYSENVKNLGDALIDMSSMLSSSMMELPLTTINNFINWKDADPGVNSNGADRFVITYINGHIEDSEAVKKIREAYDNKCEAETELQINENKIKSLKNDLAVTSRESAISTLEKELNTAKAKRNEILSIINSELTTINKYAASNNQIENAKYRIRGIYDVLDNDIKEHVIGVKTRYRYRHISTDINKVTSLPSGDGIFSEWNESTSYKTKVIQCEKTSDNKLSAIYSNGSYKFDYEPDNANLNEWSYNQIDIPITRGEAVDIEFKVIYDFGQPFVTLTSQWSKGITIKFDADAQIEDAPTTALSTIIKQTASDIEKYNLLSTLDNMGVTSHVDDNMKISNKSFYHQASNIASGIYKGGEMLSVYDLLNSLSTSMANINFDINDIENQYKVYVNVGPLPSTGIVSGINGYELKPNDDNSIQLKSFSELLEACNPNENGTYDDKTVTVDDVYEFNAKTGVTDVALNIVIENTSKTPLRLYPLFYGKSSITLNDTHSSYFSNTDYCVRIKNDNGDADYNGGVWYKYLTNSNLYESDSSSDTKLYYDKSLQTNNQFITFRTKDIYTGDEYYTPDAEVSSNNKQNSSDIGTINSSITTGMIVYPFLPSKDYLCTNNISNRSYLVVNPGEYKVIPMHCTYVCIPKRGDSGVNKQIYKTISFDLRNSLYHDPVNYSFTVIGKNYISPTEKLVVENLQHVGYTSSTNNSYYTDSEVEYKYSHKDSEN